jgi:hypothetical protein
VSTLLISNATLQYLQQNDANINGEINAAFGAVDVLSTNPPYNYPALHNSNTLYVTNANSAYDPDPTGLGAVMYDPEAWSQTPLAQQNNPVAYIEKLANQLHQVDATLNITPAPDLESSITPDTSQWPALLLQNVLLPSAPYVDAITLQFQRYEADPATFESLVANAVTALHEVNPHLQIYEDVSSAAVWGVSNANLVAEVQHIAPIVSGIWFTTPSGSDLSPAEYLFDHLAPTTIVGVADHHHAI